MRLFPLPLAQSELALVVQMDRCIKPELLDELSPVDPAAVQSRHDLRRLNMLMGHAGILRRALRSASLPRAPKRIVELGAGDGSFLLRVAQKMGADGHGIHFVLVDRHEVIRPQTRDAFKAVGCSVETITADVFDWLRQGAIQNDDVVVSNLFLHHFSEERLAQLFGLVSKEAQAFFAIEPRRAVCPLAFSHLLWFIGCNRVTRHDACISVRAGFKGTELSHLWPASSKWQLSEWRAGLFSHAFVAAKVSQSASK